METRSGQSPAPHRLADEKRPEEAALLVHVHGGGVGHGHEQAVVAAQREQPPLVGGVQRELGAAGPAGGPARLHQQDGNRVGAHLVGDGNISDITATSRSLNGAAPKHPDRPLVGGSSPKRPSPFYRRTAAGVALCPPPPRPPPPPPPPGSGWI